MRVYSEKLLEKLVDLNILKTRNLMPGENPSSYNVIRDYSTGGIEYVKVITENVTDEEVQLLLEVEKIENLNSIRKMLKFFVVLTVISIICSVIYIFQVMNI